MERPTSVPLPVGLYYFLYFYIHLIYILNRINYTTTSCILTHTQRGVIVKNVILNVNIFIKCNIRMRFGKAEVTEASYN